MLPELAVIIAADVGENSIQVKAGELVIQQAGTIRGNGHAVISLTSEGALTLDGTEEGVIRNDPASADGAHYTIAVDANTPATAQIKWNNENLMILSSYQGYSNEYFIQGLDNENTPNYLVYKDGYSVTFEYNSELYATMAKLVKTEPSS